MAPRDIFLSGLKLGDHIVFNTTQGDPLSPRLKLVPDSNLILLKIRSGEKNSASAQHARLKYSVSYLAQFTVSNWNGRVESLIYINFNGYGEPKGFDPKEHPNYR